MTWSEVCPSDMDQAPVTRGGHTVCEHRRQLFVFGGGSGTAFVNDLHVLDVERTQWQRVFVAGTAPSPRSRHTAAFVGAQMFVLFGGDDARVYGDVHAFDAASCTWRELETSGDRPRARWGRTLRLDS